MYEEDLSGSILGKLRILKKVPRIICSNRPRSAYLCQCECGEKKILPRYHLTRENNPVRSCGCARSHNNPGAPRITSAKRIYRSGYNDGDMTFEEFLVLSQKCCHYCGSPPSNNANSFLISKNAGRKTSDFAVKHGNFNYNGLDRKNNSLPHNKNNLVPCCSICNWSKGTMSLREFKVWIRKVHSHIDKAK